MADIILPTLRTRDLPSAKGLGHTFQRAPKTVKPKYEKSRECEHDRVHGAQRIFEPLLDYFAGGDEKNLEGGSRRRREERNQRRKLLLTRKLRNADSYEAHQAAATALDNLDEYATSWKSTIEPDSEDTLGHIAACTRDFEEARSSGDLRRMLETVRTDFMRNLGSVNDADLYNHSHIGTKHVIERYVASSVALVKAIVSQSAKPLPPGLTVGEVLAQLEEVKKSYGTTALVLSGGSVYGMAHIGVLRTLFEQDLLPKIISGTSAGSIVAAVMCTKKDDELPAILEDFAHGDLAVFTDQKNPESWYTHIYRTVTYGTWHDSRHITRVMESTVGDLTFREAFNRTGRILNITVSSKRGLELPSLLNYQTAPNVLIWSAVVASCSVPGLFGSSVLYAKDEATGSKFPWDPAGQLWMDGSIDNDVPLLHLGHLFGVNQAIVSQTNPHVTPFLRTEKKRLTKAFPKPALTKIVDSAKGLFSEVAALAKFEALYVSELCIQSAVWPDCFNLVHQMLSQPYTGDINILPRMSIWWAYSLVSNPTPMFMMEACRVGERNTWPNVCRIENSLAVEQALDRAISQLAEMKTFSESQVNLRRLYTGYPDLGLPPGQAKLKKKHARRGSGGALQLTMRRHLNRERLDNTVHDEYSSDSESTLAPPASLAARRGLDSMNLSSLLDAHGQLPEYKGAFRTNSLTHLPPITPSPTPSPAVTRKSYGFGGTIAPLTNLTSLINNHHVPVSSRGTQYSEEDSVGSDSEAGVEAEEEEDEDDEEDPVLLMKPGRIASPTGGSTSDQHLSSATTTTSNDRGALDTSSDPEPYEQERCFEEEEEEDDDDVDVSTRTSDDGAATDVGN